MLHILEMGSNICKEVRGPDSVKSMHMISRDRNRECQGVGVNGHLGPFRKFISFSTFTRPMDWYDYKSLLQSVSCFDFPQYNCWKNIPWTLRLLFCFNFMLKNLCLKFPKPAIYIFGLKMNPPPPLALFQKFIWFGSGILLFGTGHVTKTDDF